MFLLIAFFRRLGRAARAMWTVGNDRPMSRRMPWRHLFRRARRSPRMWLQLATIFAVVVVYPVSFFLDEETRNPIINVVMVLWLVAAIMPFVERLITRRRTAP